MGFWNRYPHRFTITFGAIALLLFVAEHINGRFWLNDFRVYYGAGDALFTGEPLYGVAHGLGTGVFKYAPVLAMVYAVFALLPYGLAASLQYALITLAFLDGIRRIDRLVREELLGGRKASYLPLFLIGITCVVHLHRELHLGNINMMLLWLLVVALEALLAGKHSWGGVLLGAAVLAKPHFLVLIPLLVLRGRSRTTGAALLTVALGLLLPTTIFGWGGNLSTHAAWFAAMAEHNTALIYVTGDDYRAVNTIYSFLHRVLLRPFIGVPHNMEAYVILGVIASLFGLLVLMDRVREKTMGTRNAFAFEYLLLIALVPSITLTDTEHFLFVAPLVAFIMHGLLPKSHLSWLPYAAVPLLIAYGGNWEDALGPLSQHMVHYGLLGIGSFGVLVLSVIMYQRSNLSATHTSK